MDEYQLQANPFRTPNSNSLISKITKSQIYWSNDKKNNWAKNKNKK